MDPIISHNGTFSIESPNGGHKTFQIKTVKNGSLKGKRILALLTGPDNTADYTGFAFVRDDGNGFAVWRKYQGIGQWEMYAKMLHNLIAHQNGVPSELADRGYKLHEATKCRVCNRKLTDPMSIKTGIGPECSGRR